MSGSGDAWFISQEERTRHDQQFHLLKPVNGLITGAIARQFFIQSGLPTQILATIWEIADADKDGMLNRSEFCVAMHLIQRKLQGLDVPGATPQPQPPTTMRSPTSGDPTATTLLTNGYAPSNGVQLTPYGVASLVPSFNPNPSISSLTNTSAPIGSHNNDAKNWLGPGLEPFSSISAPSSASRTSLLPHPNSNTINMSIPTSLVQSSGSLTSSLTTDWSIPHNSRLRTNQVFMSLDKDKTGYLSGVQVKNVLLQTQLPQTILAQIWNLSDIDLDGRLSLEEFTLAMYLCEQYKAGRLSVLPAQLPPDLVPPSYRSALQLSAVVNGFEPGMTNGNNHAPSLNTPAHCNKTSVESKSAQAESQGKPKPLPTYEDRRKENFDRGAAILEQKRSAILAAERAEREARERKEAEERDRVERQRLERERKKQQELEMAKEREKEAERLADMEKIKLLRQKQAAKRELEKKRKEERVASSLEELEGKIRRERASLAALKTTSRDLECESQNMGEKVSNVEQTLKDTAAVRDKAEQCKMELDAKCEQARSRLANAHRDLQNARQRLQDLTYQRGKAHLAPANNSGVGGALASAETQKQTLQSSIASLKRQLAEGNDEKGVPKDSHMMRTVAEAANNEDPFGMPALSTQSLVFSQASSDPFGQDLFAPPPKIEQHKSVESATSACHEVYNNFDYLRNAEGKPVLGDVDPFAASLLSGRYSLPGDPTDALALELKEKMDIMKRKSLTNTAQNPVGDPFLPHQNTNRNQVKICTTSGPIPPNSALPSGPSHHSNATNDDSTKLCPYKALFQFDARSEDEISFKPDDIILVAEDETSEPGWLGGKIGDRVGWFPAAYTQKVTSTNNANSNVVRQVSIPFLSLGNIPEETSSADSHIYQDPLELREIAGREGEIKLRQSEGVIKAVAIYPLQSTTEGDLSFAQGDIMTISQEPDSNWWIATMGDKSGYVPKSYVKILSDPNSSRPSSTPGIRPPPAGKQNSSNLASTGNISRSEATSPTGDRRNSSNIWNSPPTDHASPSKNVDADSAWASFDATNTGPLSSISTTNNSGNKIEGVGSKYVAVYPYASNEVGDLVFKPGDVIMVQDEEARDSSNADWWTGTLLSTGAKGTFPSNYVTKMAANLAQTQPPLTNTQKFTQQHQRKSSTGSVGSVVSETASHKSGGNSKRSMETVIAIAPFIASGPEQMSLSPGMILSVRRKTPTGWWEGEIVPKVGQGSAKKQIGWFPGSHVKPVKASLNDPERKVGSAWAKPSGGNQSGTTPSAIHSPAQQPIVYAVKALFDYASNHDGDLSFKQGDLIHVTEKNDANWWTGRSASTNQIGLFPSNYVSPVSVISTYDPSNPIA